MHATADAQTGTSKLAAEFAAAMGTILEQRWLFVTARVLLTFMYWYAGLGFLLDFSGAVEAMHGYGIEPAATAAALTIVVQLVGAALVIDGRLAWLGAGMLALFTLATIPLAHHFWTMTGAAAMEARLESEEHLSVIGGLIVVSILCHVRARLAPERGISSASPDSPG